MIQKIGNMKTQFLRFAALILLVSGLHASVLAQKEKADKLYDRYDFIPAIEQYHKYLQKNPTDFDAIDRLAHCYRMTSNFEKAEYWYSRATRNESTDPMNYLYYGQALMSNEKWELAGPQFEKYLAEKSWDKMAQALLESANDYQRFYRDSAQFLVSPTNINTEQAEFSPMIYKNSVVFASTREPGKLLYNWTGESFLDLYQAAFVGKPELGEPEVLPGFVNSRYHEAGAAFNPEGTIMYFTRNNFSKSKLVKSGGIVRLKTYKAELIGDSWSNVTEFVHNSDDYSVGHPCISADGSELYFVSDMPDGKGGTDIYVCKREGNSWGKPTNLGEEINTAGNEMFPWVSPSGALYFASNGHGGLGGLDIFKVTSMGDDMQNVKNVGYPINSPRDDFALVFDDESGVGFFSSNRKGGKGADDIYAFRKRQFMLGTVVDAVSNNPLPQMKVEVYGVNGLISAFRSDEKGQFRFALDRNKNYLLVASGEDYEESRQKVSSVNFEPDQTLEVTVPMKERTPDQPAFALEGKVADEVDQAAMAGATVRITTKEIVLTADENGNYNFNLMPDADYEIRFEKPGYMDKVMFLSTKDRDPGTIKLNALLAQLIPDTALYAIFYDYDNATLRHQSYRELDRVVNFMASNPDARLRIVSHADARGSRYYNDKLSASRTGSAYDYLVAEGVEAARLERVWFGERRPANDCIDGVDCPEDDHQLNRRTEFEYIDGAELDKLIPPGPEIQLGEGGKDAIKDDSEGSQITSKDAIKGDSDGGKGGKDEIKEGSGNDGGDDGEEVEVEDPESPEPQNN